MSQLVLSRGNVYRRSVVRKFLNNFQIGPYLLVVSLVSFVILITVVTLVFSTRQVTKGYVLNHLETIHNELAKNSEIKDMEISKVRSLQYIQESQKVRQMVKTGEIAFINVDTAIASK